MLEPKEITRCNETKINVASFEYNNGIIYSKIKNLRQVTTFNEIKDFKSFIVCCGDVMVRVKENEFENIKRRDF